MSKMRKKVGVLLSGCGFLDGSEIHEATLTLFFLDRFGAEAVCIAPDINQSDVVDHYSRKPTDQIRNVLLEASRIARGNIKKIDDVDIKNLDALIFPGGFGAAKNLCDYASRGIEFTVNPAVDRIIRDMHRAKKPIGFICIAPVIAAKVLGEFHPELTIGSDKATADLILGKGARHKVCAVDEIAVDENNKIVSTPAYMLGPGISSIALGIEKLVLKVLDLVGR